MRIFANFLSQLTRAIGFVTSPKFCQTDLLFRGRLSPKASHLQAPATCVSDWSRRGLLRIKNCKICINNLSRFSAAKFSNRVITEFRREDETMQRKMYDATGHCETGVTVVHHVTAVVVVNYAGDDVADGETWEMAFFA